MSDCNSSSPRVRARSRCASTWVQPGTGAGRSRQRIVTRVVLADPLPQAQIAARPAARHNRRVLVEGHGLRRELPAKPVGLFGDDDAEAAPGGGERGGAAAQATADDDDIRGDRLFRGRRAAYDPWQERGGRGTSGETQEGAAAALHPWRRSS